LLNSPSGDFLRNNETNFESRRLGRLDLRDALGAKVELTGEFSTSASRRILKMWPDCELRPTHLPEFSGVIECVTPQYSQLARSSRLSGLSSG
jgi:hypothetical protein